MGKPRALRIANDAVANEERTPESFRETRPVRDVGE